MEYARKIKGEIMIAGAYKELTEIYSKVGFERQPFFLPLRILVTPTQTLIHVEFENGHKEIFTNKHLKTMADCNGGGNWDHVKRIVVREEVI